jgi:hypothetical protein
MINIKSKKGKIQQQRELVLIMMQIERAWTKPLTKIIKQFYIDAAEQVEKGFTGRVEYVVDKRVPELRILFKKYYKIIGLTFFRKLFQDFKKSGYGYQKKGFDDWYDGLEEIEMGPVEERYWKVFGEWSSKQMGKKIGKVTSTAKKKISHIIADMMEEEVRTHKDIAKEILATGERSSIWEALRIARTETHSASVFSTQASVNSAGEEVGVIFNKYWLSANDPRSRSGHIAAGEYYNEEGAIPMDESYMVAAEEGDDEEPLDYPGDPSGSPENIINCRCVELYVQAEAGQENPS